MITHIRSGFTFLGQSFRKRGAILHITPAREGVLALRQKLGTLIRDYVGAPMPALIRKLNQTLRGWGNYHRHVVASDAFSDVDSYVYEQLWRMLRRRHPKKSKRWLAGKYWLTPGSRWVFSATWSTRNGMRQAQVIRLSSIGIRRHLKVKADANPYLSEYSAYFRRRRLARVARRPSSSFARWYPVFAD